MAAKPDGGVEAYLNGVPEPSRAALETLRAAIKAAAPGASEAISYGVPTFKQGRSLVSFGVAKAHLSFYGMSPATLDRFKRELAGFDTSKGTVRFTPDKPIPAELVQRIVAARLAENAAMDAARDRARKSRKPTSRPRTPRR